MEERAAQVGHTVDPQFQAYPEPSRPRDGSVSDGLGDAPSAVFANVSAVGQPQATASAADSETTKARKGGRRDKPSRAAVPRGRDRPVGEGPAFGEWLDNKQKADFPESTTPSKTAAVIAGPVANAATTSSIPVQIDKTYKVRVERNGEQTRFIGQLDKIEWVRFKYVIQGVITTVAKTLKVDRARITVEPDVTALPNGTARPSFILNIPRLVSAAEQDDLNVAYSAFNQTLRGQSASLDADLLAFSNPEAADAGRSAAEDVRRIAGGRNLPEPLKLGTALGASQEVKVEGRIGGHPDPEEDKEAFKLSGKVISTMTEEHRFKIRAFVFKDNYGKERKSVHGKVVEINYSEKDHKEAVLGLPLGRDQIVEFELTPRVGGKRDKLMLKSIVAPVLGVAAESNDSTKP